MSCECWHRFVVEDSSLIASLGGASVCSPGSHFCGPVLCENLGLCTGNYDSMVVGSCGVFNQQMMASCSPGVILEVGASHPGCGHCRLQYSAWFCVPVKCFLKLGPHIQAVGTVSYSIVHGSVCCRLVVSSSLCGRQNRKRTLEGVCPLWVPIILKICMYVLYSLSFFKNIKWNDI